MVTRPNRFALDLETECNVDGCTDSTCEHALTPHLARITVIGVWSPTFQRTFRDLSLFKRWLKSLPKGYEFVGQNFKFDIKMLHFHGVKIELDSWVSDSQLQAATSLAKVDKKYLSWYANEREIRNRKLPRGSRKHRAGTPKSLKVLAPYFLRVKPFWEDPTEHDNDEYVLKDCEYAYRLVDFFDDKLKKEGQFDLFYNKRMKWARMLLQSELIGIRIDMDKLAEFEKEAEQKTEEIKRKLDKEWAEVYEAYRQKKIKECRAGYDAKLAQAINKIAAGVDSPSYLERAKKTRLRYAKLCENAVKKVPYGMNLNSPAQLAWIFRDYFGLDITDFEGDESTGKAVLKLLAAQGRKDIETFLEYRAWRKLSTSFFPTYRELQLNGVIHTNFNPDGTRTGRISCSGPNLQQVPGRLHELFIPRPGYKMFSLDMSAIEAMLIAYFTEDPTLIKLIQNGDDIHGFHATIWCDLVISPNEVKTKEPKARGVSKTIGYAAFYGAAGPRAQHAGLTHGYNWPDSDCALKVRRFREAYKQVFDYKADIDKMAERQPIPDIFGFLTSYPDRQDIYMKAFNTKIQGSASNMLLNSAYKATQEYLAKKLDARLLLYVHDEIVGEAREDQVQEAFDIAMKHLTSYKLDTPLGPIQLKSEGHIGDHWTK